MFILSHSAAKIVPSANLASAHLSADLFQRLCIITQVKSAAMSEVTQFLRQSREADAHEGKAVANHGAKWLTYTRAKCGAARKRVNPHDPPDMKAVISLLITMKHDYNEWMSERRQRTETRKKKRPERERKKERSESKLIKMTAELWTGKKERDKFQTDMCDMLHITKSQQERRNAYTCACNNTVIKPELVFTRKAAL